MSFEFFFSPFFGKDVEHVNSNPIIKVTPIYFYCTITTKTCIIITAINTCLVGVYSEQIRVWAEYRHP